MEIKPSVVAFPWVLGAELLYTSLSLNNLVCHLNLYRAGLVTYVLSSVLDLVHTNSKAQSSVQVLFDLVKRAELVVGVANWEKSVGVWEVGTCLFVLNGAYRRSLGRDLKRQGRTIITWSRNLLLRQGACCSLPLHL